LVEYRPDQGGCFLGNPVERPDGDLRLDFEESMPMAAMAPEDGLVPRVNGRSSGIRDDNDEDEHGVGTCPKATGA